MLDTYEAGVEFYRHHSDRRTTFMLASLQPATLSAAQGRQNGAPVSLRAGLADPPEDWPAASLCDAAAVITFEPKILARVIYTAYVDESLKLLLAWILVSAKYIRRCGRYIPRL